MREHCLLSSNIKEGVEKNPLNSLHALGHANVHADGRSDKKRRTPYRERERGPFKGKEGSSKKLKIHALPPKWPSSGVTLRFKGAIHGAIFCEKFHSENSRFTFVMLTNFHIFNEY